MLNAEHDMRVSPSFARPFTNSSLVPRTTACSLREIAAVNLFADLGSTRSHNEHVLNNV